MRGAVSLPPWKPEVLLSDGSVSVARAVSAASAKPGECVFPGVIQRTRNV